LDTVIAVGLDERKIIDEFYSLGARAFIIDVANGFNTAVEPTIKQIRDLKNTYIFCGNVDSEEGFKYLSDLGVDAIRVGIGSGSMCTTSIMTGVGQGIVSSIQECRSIKEKIGSKSLLIADGGIRAVGDIAKAMTVGADAVMVGRMFAGTKEAEGNILKYNGKLYKAYRGSASYAVQQKRGKNPYYVEGDETIVEYKGGVQNILDQIEAGLRSSMSYMAASNLEQLKKNGSYVIKHNIS
jgi:IMP dehydrogenase